MKSEILLFQTDEGRINLHVRLENETVWLTQSDMVELFQTSKSNISEHITHIFEEGELIQDSVVRKIRTTSSDGKTYSVMHYNLDVIISVGYRVKSLRGTQFRIWATERIREYIVKGFSINDELLKKGGDYYEELLERIREIRASEKIFFRKILELYATSLDYDPHASASIQFFQTVQNKLHWAAHGHTAAEIIYQRANADLPFMGLQAFSGKYPTKKDIGIAKNYLTEEELSILNRLVSAYLEIAELHAMQRKAMYMKDWLELLDGFMKMSRQDILTNAGTISAQLAQTKAQKEYEEFKSKKDLDISEVERHFFEDMESIIKKISTTDGKNSKPKH